MGQILRAVINRIFGSRYGIGLLLAVVVVLIVAAANVFDRASGPEVGSIPVPEVVVPSVTPSAGDDGVVEVPEPKKPVTRPGGEPPERVARAFAAAWLDHRGVTPESWHGKLVPHSTPELAKKLDGVDPVEVPADRMIGEPALNPRGTTTVEALIPVDSGLLRLRLVAPDGHWLVDGVDWDRGA